MEPNQEAAATAVPVHGSVIPSGDNGGFNPIEFPIGYRFLPSDEELITDYLVKKLLDQDLPADIVKEVDLYKYSPQELEQLYGARREKEMYFFTRTKLKYANGSRPNREAPGGTWRASTSKIPIRGGNGRKIGDKMMLVYHKTENKQKTDWLMHEYTIPSNSKKTEGYVLCKLYNKSSKQVLQISALPEKPPQNKELHTEPNHAANHLHQDQEPLVPQTYLDCLPQQHLACQNNQQEGYHDSQPLQDYPNILLQGYDPNIQLQGNDPNIRSQGYDPNIQLQGCDPNIQLQGYDPNIQSQGYDPNIQLQGYDPNIQLQGSDPNIQLQGSDPNFQLQVSDPNFQLQVSDPNILSQWCDEYIIQSLWDDEYVQLHCYDQALQLQWYDQVVRSSQATNTNVQAEEDREQEDFQQQQ